jgi:ubiquitin thioesterase protein OTUB1
VAFGYFESLFHLRDTTKVAKELDRIKSFNQLLNAVGQDENLYDIFVDATEDLLLQVSNAIENGTQDESFLLEAFNAEYNSNAIITHFRVASTFSLLPSP